MSKNASSADNQQGSFRQLADNPSETTRQIPHISKDLSILLGLLFSDGCVSPKGVSSWRICFVNKSKSLVELFSDCIINIFNLPKHRVRLGKTNDGLLTAVVDSKEIGNYLVGMFGTFRTLKFADGKLPNAKLPTESLLASGVEKEFLATAFSCDGGICFYTAKRNGARGGTVWLIRNVFLACAHLTLRADYLYLLNKLEIGAKEIPKDGKIRIQKESDIRKFYEIIGFLPGVEVNNHSKFWSGCKKQEVLELLLSSYGNPSKIYNLAKFNRGNDIVHSL